MIHTVMITSGPGCR